MSALDGDRYRLLKSKISPLGRRLKEAARTYGSLVHEWTSEHDSRPEGSQPPPLRRAIRVQFAVIEALIHREIKTRFGKYRLGYIWALLDPALQIGVWFFIFAIIRTMPATHDMGTVLFLATGVIPYFLFRNVSQFVGGAVAGNRSLLRFPLVSQIDTLIARVILETITMSIVAIVCFTILISTGNGYYPRDISGILGAAAALFLLGFGFGSFNCMATILWPVYSRFLRIIQRFFYFSSGIFFTMDHMPAVAQKWLAWNPILHGVEAFRTAWSYSYVSQMVSHSYLVSCGVIFLLLALILNHSVRRKLEGE